VVPPSLSPFCTVIDEIDLDCVEDGPAETDEDEVCTRTDPFLLPGSCVEWYCTHCQ